jgi:hypothetical protein
MTESIIGFTFGILTLVFMALPFVHRSYPGINQSGYDLLQGSFTYNGSVWHDAYCPHPTLLLDVAAGAVVALLGFIALLSSLESDWRSKASILRVLRGSMLVGGILVVIGILSAALQVEVYVGGVMYREALVTYPVFGFWASVGLGLLMYIVGSRLMKMERQ